MTKARSARLITLLCALATLLCAGCTVFPDRQKPARELADFFKRVPGVTYVDPGYTNTMTNGAGYQVWVHVEQTVDAAALSQAARMFVEAADEVGFPDHDLRLWFVVRNHPADDSIAAIRLTDSWQKRNGVTADEAAAATELWANALSFPGVTRAGLRLPDDEYATGREKGIGATVRDEATGAALQQRYPALAGHWSIAMGTS